jgi:amino acid adenylation domain-containing protein
MNQPVVEGFGLSPLQHRLWSVRARGPDGPWLATARVRLTGPLERARLRAALAAVVAEHEILRTSFPCLPGTHVPVQSIRPASEPTLVERAARAGAELAGELTELEVELARSLDLASAAVLAAGLLVLAPAEHVLVLVQPALVADEESLSNLVRALASRLRGEAPGVDSAPLQFADIAQWLHENLESSEAQAGFDAWRATLVPEPEELRLPLATERPGEGFEPHEHLRRATPEERAGVARAAAATGTSEAAVLLATWQTLLARLAEREEFLLGYKSPGRVAEGLADAFGPFARFLPLRARHVAEETFASLVQRVERARLQAESWHELFDPERAGVKDERAFAHGFACFSERARGRTSESASGPAGELRLELERRRATSEPCGLLLSFDAAEAEPAWRFAYDARSWRAPDVEVVAEEFAALLASACAHPEAAVGSLSMLSAAMRARLLDAFARASTPRTLARSIEEEISAVARANPAAPAVFAEGHTLTYGELEARAGRLARRLRSLGVGPGDFVGLYLDRSVDMLVGILGVLEAGGAYVPLPPGYPAERIAFMLEDSGARVLVTRTREAAALGPFSGTIVRLDDEAALAESAGTDAPVAAPPAPPGPSAPLGAPAYVIYTSGSTGKPKGVVVTRANLAHSTLARLEYYRRKPECYLLLSSFAFDSSVAGIFWTLAQGGKLVLPSEGFEQEIPAVARLVREHRVTHLLALPSLWNVMLETRKGDELASLTTVIVAGEACPAELVRRHREALPRVELHDEYGPTEGTVWSTVFDCSLPFERLQVPIGRPVPGAEAYVVDRAGELAPIGLAGELWIGGPGIAAGYHERPELTAERFVADPFHPGPPGPDGRGRRLYRTGDLARFLADGNLEFLGRIDHQVKIRGYRVELPEIEAALMAHPRVREAVVLVREDAPGDRRLVAYVTAKGGPATNGGALGPAELREHLSGPLPEYMVPAHFVLLPDMPLLPNGKVDRKRLPAPEQDRSGVRAPYVAPRSALEKVLAMIWSDVLKTPEIGVEDDFFELGGHSILATQLFARMTDMLQAKIPLRAIFDERTVAGLARAMLAEAPDRARLERTAEVVLQVLGMSEAEAAAALERR